MKTMTCRQMGGDCEMSFTAETADEMMNKGMAHLMDMKAKGDEVHAKSIVMADEGSKNEEAGKAWYTKFTADFAALPQN